MLTKFNSLKVTISEQTASIIGSVYNVKENEQTSLKNADVEKKIIVE